MPLWPERNKGDGHTGRRRRAPIGFRVAHQHGAIHAPPRSFHRKPVGGRIGLSDRQRVRTDHRAEKPAHAEPGQQQLGQAFRLVRADAGRETFSPKDFHGLDHARIERRVAVDPGLVGCQKPGILGIDLGLATLSESRKAQAQHCPSAVKGRQRIRDRIEHVACTQVAKTGIRRVDKVGRRVRERAVEIENYRSHAFLAL